MSKLIMGDFLPDFSFQTPYLQNCKIGTIAKQVSGKTALIFLRYYGCTLCQYDIQLFAEAYNEIKKTDGQILIVLQSDPSKLATELSDTDVPFHIICDPDQILYKEFEIGAADSVMGLVDATTIEKISRVNAAGYVHGDYEGEELQLPATIIVNRELELIYVRYGQSAGDVPNLFII